MYICICIILMNSKQCFPKHHILLWYQNIISFFFLLHSSTWLLTTLYPQSHNTTIHNMNDSHNTLININIAVQTPLKVTSTNYVSWELQFQTLFVGYDFLGYIDDSKPCPYRTFTQNGVIIYIKSSLYNLD